MSEIETAYSVQDWTARVVKISMLKKESANSDAENVENAGNTTDEANIYALQSIKKQHQEC